MSLLSTRMMFRGVSSALRTISFAKHSFSTVSQSLASPIKFSDNVSLKNPFHIVMKKKNEDTLEVEVLFANSHEQKVTVLSLDMDGTISDLIQGISETYNLDGDLRAFTMDKKELSQTVKLDDLEGSNFYIADLSDEKLFFLVKNEDVEVKNNYNIINSYCRDISLSYLEKKIVTNFLQRVDSVAKAKHGTEIFSDSVQPNPALGAQAQRVLINKNDLIKTLFEALPSNRNLNSEFEGQLMERYQQLQIQLSSLTQQKDDIEAIAHGKVKRNMAIGLLALIGQFGFVGVGTYHIWSWDIVEPMAYFLTSAGVIYLNTHFFKYFQDYSNEGYYEYLKRKQMEKLYSKYNFNIANYLALQEELATIERSIKSNLLVNL